MRFKIRHYDYSQITPQTAKRWVKDIKVLVTRNADANVSYNLRKMFSYIEMLIQYQTPMKPTDISDDGHKFTCPRCGTQFDTEDNVEDFNLCYICGQRFKESDYND